MMMKILSVVLEAFWYPLSIAALAVLICLIAWWKGRWITADMAMERAGILIVTVLTAAIVLGGGILMVWSFGTVVLATFNLSDSPLVAAVPKWHGLPYLVWYFFGIVGFAGVAGLSRVFWVACRWVRNNK